MNARNASVSHTIELRMTADTFPRPFGRYTLLANLAQGGMGALYVACQGDVGLEKLSVIKTVLPHLADKEYVARFRDEAKVVVRLSHGNLVPVFDAGMQKLDGDDELYLAMDYVDGKDLRAVWNRCAKKGIAFPVDVAVYIARELARGLHYAHTFGSIKLVHRDVSPPNVLLSFNGEVKLTDFGLAASTLKTEKTAPGVIYGKVSYMSPEQARGEPIDGRTDMFAVGLILWELLTGRQLFPQSEHNLIARVRDPNIGAPSETAGRVPPALDAIVLKALQKDRTLRYADCEEFRAALAGFLAKNSPTIDNDRVAKFLQQLFGEEIEADRAARQAQLEGLAGWRAARVTSEAKQNVSQPETVDMQPRPEVKSGLVGSYIDGRYLVKRMIGEGGMGLVYEAEHVEIGRRVAIKVLHAMYTRSAEVLARFRAEARAATRIGNPHIVEVLDSGTTVDGAVYFVMEFLDGRSLADAIHRDKTLPTARVIAIGREICQALSAAHASGIIHRDMKPDNVFLISRDGRGDFVKVLDFGIAKTHDAVSERVGRLTNPGTAMGTPEYMAPEQAAAGATDHRVDIYAVGAILYEMLTGRPPHEGANIMEVLTRKATQAIVPVAERRPDVPRELERLVMRMLATDPAARPQSMESLAQDLGALAGVPVSTGQLPSLTSNTDRIPRRRGLYIAGGVAAASVMFAATAWWVSHQSATPHVRPLSVASATEPESPRPAPAVAPTPPAAKPAPPVEAEKPKVVAVSPVTVKPTPRPAPKPAPSTVPAPAAAKPDLRAEAKKKLQAARSALSSRHFAEAEILYQEALATNVEKGAASTGLAEVAFERGNLDEAVRWARRAIDGGGGVPARMVLGNTFFKLKRYDEAILEYQSVLKIDATHAEALANLHAAQARKGL
jgi:serine/threonine-protein kinase